MKKLKQIKDAIKNTSPEKLARIEYRSHFIISRGFWYIIFAFVFSLGVSYSQGISALQKYTAIKEIIGDTYDVKKDKSPSRKRDYIVKSVFGKFMWVWVILLSAFLTFFIVPLSTFLNKILFSFTFLSIYVIFYFFFFYWFAKKIYDSRNDLNKTGGKKSQRKK